MESLIGYVLSCKCCGKIFVICKHCYRGHKYCTDSCRVEGYELSRKRARNKYNSSLEAKLDHRDRSQRYRLKNKKSVTDKTSKESNTTIDMHSHKAIHQELDELKTQKGICILCQTTIFKEGVHLYGGPI